MTAPTEIEEDKKDIDEYLQAPRRKRKSYVLLAFNKNFDKDLFSGIDGFIKKQFPSYSVMRPKSDKELSRLIGRQIALLAIDDDFVGINRSMEIVQELKSKKSETPIPVLFMTTREFDVIEAYSKTLAIHQEVDNYIAFRKLSPQQIFSRFSDSLNISKKSRRSRRYLVDIKLTFNELRTNSSIKGTLKDISMHGGVIESNPDYQIFKNNQQIMVKIPIDSLLPNEPSDFLRLSAKIRRVFMGGHRAGVSWEHVNDHQFIMLTKFLMEHVSRQNARPLK